MPNQRDPDRIPIILEHLNELWQEHPDLRLGQIVELAASAGYPYVASSHDVFMVEDNIILDGLEKLKQEY